MKNIKYLINLLLVFSLLLLIPSCAINPVTGKKQLMLMSEAQEVALGAQYDPSVISTFGVYDSPKLLSFITTKGNEIGKISHRPNLEFHYKILDSPVINAFAVPGGYLYFTRGILAQFNNEAELIGVLGHEMGHVTARHSASQQTKQQIGSILLAGGILFAPKEFQQFAGYASQGMQLLFLKFSRDNESEADRLGVEYSSKINYDAHKMADFFNVLNKMQMGSDHAGVPTFMSTHPDPGDRYTSVNRKTEQWQDSLKRTNWAVNGDSYLRMIDGLVYGEDPRQGFVEANVFYHPELKFKYPIPQGWKHQNSPMQVQMASKDGKAMMIFTLAPQKTLDEASQTILKDLKLTVLDTKRTTVNGMSAIATVSQQVSQNQQTGQEQIIKVMSYFIQYNGAIYVFHGVAAEADFNSNYRTFESTMVNFRKLSEASKLNVKPDRIKIIKINSASVSLEDAFKYYKVPQSRYKEFALLNNMELNHNLTSGDLIKVLGK
ncbi:MAG: M48 family metalloprotease [Bacteroidetes bacterium]|nr:M48 family metalloprotease [Bacteroidota bacterium]